MEQLVQKARPILYAGPQGGPRDSQGTTAIIAASNYNRRMSSSAGTAGTQWPHLPGYSTSGLQMTAPSQSQSGSTVTYANKTKSTVNVEAIDPRDLLLEQSLLTLKINKLGNDLSQDPVKVNLSDAMEELDHLG